MLTVYITDAIRILTENTAKMVHEGVLIKSRYVDLLNIDSGEEKESSEEVISRIKSKLKALGDE